MSEKPIQARQLVLNFPVHPRYSFSGFVVSEGSRFAFSMAHRVCTDRSFNMLYLAGEKGLGKTHLLMSIGNHIAENFPDRKVLYLDGENFAKTMGDAGSTEQALGQILDTDYFLLDNIERIAGHASAQEKLYLVYNSLMEKKKTIVFAGDRSPDHLPDIADYLTSRFQWGVMARLKPIDDATTAQIIKKLGHDLGIEIPDNIINYLLTHIPRDFQSIQNTVAQINRASYERKKKITLPLVKGVLGLTG